MFQKLNLLSLAWVMQQGQRSGRMRQKKDVNLWNTDTRLGGNNNVSLLIKRITSVVFQKPQGNPEKSRALDNEFSWETQQIWNLLNIFIPPSALFFKTEGSFCWCFSPHKTDKPVFYLFPVFEVGFLKEINLHTKLLAVLRCAEESGEQKSHHQALTSIYRNIHFEFSFIYNMILSSRSWTRWLHLDFKVFLWLLSFRIHCCIQPGSRAANQDSTAAAWFTAWGRRKFSCSFWPRPSLNTVQQLF